MRLPALFSLAVALAGCGLIDSVSGPKALSIQKFEATPDEVQSGTAVTLAWDVEGSEAVAINNGIGNVPSRGSRTFPAYASSTFTLTARAGTSSATSSVVVSVSGSGGGNPFPSPTPSPSPTPGAGPTPNPSPEPSPTPDPTGSGGCGAEAETDVNGCTIGWEYPMDFREDQCLRVNEVTLERACPVVGGFEQKVGIALTADTSLSSLRWRSAKVNKDVVTPSEGRLEPSGEQTIDLTALVRSPALYLEFVDDQNRVRMILRVKHKE